MRGADLGVTIAVRTAVVIRRGLAVPPRNTLASFPHYHGKTYVNVIVNEGRNNYFKANANAQKTKTAFRSEQRLKQSLNHSYITFQVINESKINLKGRTIS